MYHNSCTFHSSAVPLSTSISLLFKWPFFYFDIFYISPGLHWPWWSIIKIAIRILKYIQKTNLRQTREIFKGPTLCKVVSEAICLCLILYHFCLPMQFWVCSLWGHQGCWYVSQTGISSTITDPLICILNGRLETAGKLCSLVCVNLKLHVMQLNWIKETLLFPPHQNKWKVKNSIVLLLAGWCKHRAKCAAAGWRGITPTTSQDSSVTKAYLDEGS